MLQKSYTLARYRISKVFCVSRQMLSNGNSFICMGELSEPIYFLKWMYFISYSDHHKQFALWNRMSVCVCECTRLYAYLKKSTKIEMEFKIVWNKFASNIAMPLYDKKKSDRSPLLDMIFRCLNFFATVERVSVLYFDFVSQTHWRIYSTHTEHEHEQST